MSGANTPTSPYPPVGGGNLNKYPSMTSVHSVISMGYLPPGHGYVVKKQKPDKPYGLPFTTRLNRTHRGPGTKYLYYALAAFIVCLFFVLGAGLFFGHRNVSRMIVLRTEVIGAVMLILAIIAFAVMGEYIWKARVESNRWRAGIRFKAEGVNTAAAIHKTYVPESVSGVKLQSGTYGPKALKEIPKPKSKKKKGKSKAGSRQNLATIGEVPGPTALPPSAAPKSYAQHPVAPIAPPRYDNRPPPAFQPYAGGRSPGPPISPGPGYAAHGSSNPAFRLEEMSQHPHQVHFQSMGEADSSV